MLSSATPASEPKDGVVINIPKFKFDYELDFKADLQALGISSAFNQVNADFSRMASEPLYVSDAVHKASLNFSEDGIKAAAVTAFVMKVGAMESEEEPQPVIIDIDHPFLFLIRDANNGTIWFVGTVYQPNLWADDADEYHR
jgi:serpin B